MFNLCLLDLALWDELDACWEEYGGEDDEALFECEQSAWDDYYGDDYYGDDYYGTDYYGNDYNGTDYYQWRRVQAKSMRLQAKNRRN